MKHLSTIASCASICLFCGNSYASHIYTNAISTHNIASLQHSITQTAFSSFNNTNTSTGDAIPQSSYKKNQAATYGHAPMYGTMSIYGEYNDDGRSGGDTTSARQTINNAWINWQHVENNAKFDEISRTHSKHNLYLAGLTSNQTKKRTAHTAWGIYTGYLDGNTTNKTIDTDSNGGFFGLYNRYQNTKLNISSTINGGAVNNSTKNIFGTDETTNFWFGGAISTSYKFALDSTFAIQPNAHIGYTWIKSENYTSASGDIIKNNATNTFELSPGINITKHISNNWFGKIDVKHIMFFTNGGDITVNDHDIKALTDHNFTEYSISLEKSTKNLVFQTNIGRRDGGHSGWIGGINIKYVF